jgi:hypothetical protein
MNAETLEHKIAFHPFWKGIDPDHLRLMQEIAISERFQAGQLIFQEKMKVMGRPFVTKAHGFVATRIYTRKMFYRTGRSGLALGR